MPGSRGPTVADQTSLVPDSRTLALFVHSPLTVTEVTFEAWKRKITRRSCCTSGETIAGRRGGGLVEVDSAAWVTIVARNRRPKEMSFTRTLCPNCPCKGRLKFPG